MKKIFSTFVALLAAANMMAQGWPDNYGGVMLQSFYWDSYNSLSISYHFFISN